MKQKYKISELEKKISELENRIAILEAARWLLIYSPLPIYSPILNPVRVIYQQPCTYCGEWNCDKNHVFITTS